MSEQEKPPASGAIPAQEANAAEPHDAAPEPADGLSPPPLPHALPPPLPSSDPQPRGAPGEGEATFPAGGTRGPTAASLEGAAQFPSSAREPFEAAAAHYSGSDYLPLKQHWLGYFLAALVLAAGIAGAAVFGSLWGEFMLAGIDVLPFALLAWLAYLGLRRTWAKVLAFIWLGALVVATAGLATLLIVALSSVPEQAGDFLNGAAWEVGVVALTNLLGIGVSVLVLAPRVRHALARWIPIHPQSLVHTIALSMVCGATAISLGQLIALGGEPPILTMIQAAPETFELSPAEVLLSMVFGLVWMIPGALVAVGFPVVRTWKVALARLGVVRPTPRQVWGGTALALALAGGVAVLAPAIENTWEFLGWPLTDEAAFDKLLGALITPIGAVVIAVSAGVGEELVVRGALQPRLGFLLSNLFFTSLHAFQYGFDALLTVFLGGCVLGVVRARSNTTTCAIVHGVYDFVLVMAAVLSK